MIVKFVITLLVAGLVWMIAKRVRTLPRGEDHAKTGTTPINSLHKCGACGIYLPDGKTCDCTNRS